MGKEIYEKIYEKPGAVWTKNGPREELVKLVESGKIKPCKVLVTACGEGFDCIYLASKGFDVLGIDISDKAIEYAKKNAEEAGVKIRFMQMDVFALDKLEEKFDFVLEWALLHCVERETWDKYIENVAKLLNDDGKYLSVCFNINSPEFGGEEKKIRESHLGTYLYFSSQEELKELFEPYFKIIESRLIDLAGKEGPNHIANFFFMEKK